MIGVLLALACAGCIVLVFHVTVELNTIQKKVQEIILNLQKKYNQSSG